MRHNKRNHSHWFFWDFKIP